MPERRWRWVGDRALLRVLDDPDLSRANAGALALHRALRDRGFPEVEDLVPGARSLLVVLVEGAEPSSALVRALDADPPPPPAAPVRTREIPVRYGGDDGPDLVDVARRVGLAEDEVVRRHREALYIVAFLGFAPGFAYLLGLPGELAVPRLEAPRTRVPAGSVGIGGRWTGVYPRATPGGWRLIGRTETVVFDPDRDPPALLAPGDRVRFVPA
jgi:KipI family sensor histidine kinase inhibitor